MDGMVKLWIGFCPRRKYDSVNNLIDIIRGSNGSPQLNVLSLDFFRLPSCYELCCILLLCMEWNGIKWQFEWESGGGITFSGVIFMSVDIRGQHIDKMTINKPSALLLHSHTLVHLPPSLPFSVFLALNWNCCKQCDYLFFHSSIGIGVSRCAVMWAF